MRTLSVIALALLVGCGAEAPTQTSDASTSDAPSDGSTCARGREVLLGGRCVPATDSNCNGVACRAGTFCTLDSDGTTTSLVCLAP